MNIDEQVKAKLKELLEAELENIDDGIGLALAQDEWRPSQALKQELECEKRAIERLLRKVTRATRS